MKIEYHEFTVHDLTHYFIKGFNQKDIKIVNYEAFVDTAKDKVIFKLFIEETPEAKL